MYAVVALSRCIQGRSCGTRAKDRLLRRRWVREEANTTVLPHRALKRAATLREDDTTNLQCDLGRLNRLLDELAAERNMAERATLSAADVALADTARSSKRWMLRA
jgi:hypothetical protein